MKDKAPVGYAVGKDLAIESFRSEEKPYFVFEHRIAGVIKDAPATVRIYKPPMQNDSFLNYLEWKMNQPWHKRQFLPISYLEFSCIQSKRNKEDNRKIM